MKSSITIACQCGRELTLKASGTKPFEDAQCTECHTPIFFIEPLANSVAIRVFNRAWAELQNGDFTLAIVFSAMAVECELAGLFIKWKGIELMATASRSPTEAERNVWAEESRKWRGIAVRLDKVSELLTGQDFDSFLSHNPALLKAVHEKCPSPEMRRSPKDLFRKALFDRRNRILHRGEIDFQEADAGICFTLAAALYRILNEMDSQRNKRLQAELDAGLPTRGNPVRRR